MNIFIVLMVIYIAAMLLLGYLGSKRATDSTSYATSNGDVSVFNVCQCGNLLGCRRPGLCLWLD